MKSTLPNYMPPQQLQTVPVPQYDPNLGEWEEF